MQRVWDSVCVCDCAREARRWFVMLGLAAGCEGQTGRALRKGCVSLTNNMPAVELELSRMLAEL